MYPLTYSAIYKTPEKHQPPEDSELCYDTEYPNLNSRDYAKRPLNRALRMHSGWECITLNDVEQVIIATNKLSGRQWTSTLWGFDGPWNTIIKKEGYELNGDSDWNIETEDNANGCTSASFQFTATDSVFKLECTALTSCLKYATPSIFLSAQRTGKLQMWSTRSELRHADKPYCLFLIGEKCEHLKPIVSMEIMLGNVNKSVTGCEAGTLRLWDMGGADLLPVQAYRFAHTDTINAIAASPSSASIFATCSSDKSALLWDECLSFPATALYDKHNVRFSHIAWANDPTENELLVGDDIGWLHCVDKRQSNKWLRSVQIFDRPIRKIVPHNDHIAVIGDTNVVKIIDASTFEVRYENSAAQHFVRDGVWRNKAAEFLTIGYDAILRKHAVPIKAAF